MIDQKYSYLITKTCNKRPKQIKNISRIGINFLPLSIDKYIKLKTGVGGKENLE